MKILGLIVEYNPFHNGHLYHLHQSVKKTTPDLIIAIMSGDFLQRGEPALVNKWSRTKMALRAGVDLVVELPYLYAVQKADIFAEGAVSRLAQLGVTDICFGSEEGDISPFFNTLNWMNKHQSLIDERLKTELSKGKSYPKAFSDAVIGLQPPDTVLDLSKPNNILGYHYVKSSFNQQTSIRMHTIKRSGSEYNDRDLSHASIASATALRHMLITDKRPLDFLKPYVPSYSLEQLSAYFSLYNKFHTWDDYFPFIKHALISQDNDTLNQIYECEEGLENRLKKAIITSAGFDDFISNIKAKRYTRTRLQRLLVHLYLKTNKLFVKKHLDEQQPPYIRVLGMSDKGQDHLSKLKKLTTSPIITTASKSQHPVFQKDILASRLHGIPNHQTGMSFMDEYQTGPLRYRVNSGAFK
ncbi:nucleotidyltransferase [Salipaludibacillus agaradhaerens]|uniref:tRNA(Met) cytidine acetate ligase n=1 Tax=Salipaludibacillus agaradhaerens TaxID=76935 RepID=A0A9Q4FYN7_SALAG|nr:nucleotidyltransferase [Salipaludibacillus agaradhaerens]MCR6095928.1 nucleotidyltransferase [Salipaludibacillus agaradhaerens]MCR6114513.1 nucleotidyltransferase [Salipaludibacillus agaradhaerens]